MDASKLSNKELIQNYNEYVERDNYATHHLDKRYYNNRMEKVFASGMKTLYEHEMRNRGFIK